MKIHFSKSQFSKEFGWHFQNIFVGKFRWPEMRNFHQGKSHPFFSGKQGYKSLPFFNGKQGYQSVIRTYKTQKETS
jgi:hypothetical protein